MSIKAFLFCWVFAFSFAYADEMDDEIIQDLDFYTNLEVVENQELVSNMDQVPDESAPTIKDESHVPN